MNNLVILNLLLVVVVCAFYLWCIARIIKAFKKVLKDCDFKNGAANTIALSICGIVMLITVFVQAGCMVFAIKQLL